MNIILLTATILTLALVRGGQASNAQPCQGTSDMSAYYNFKKRHILQLDFDLNSIRAWRRYLWNNRLCGRARVQSFIKKDDKKNVLEICSDAGRFLRGNLCISNSTMLVYYVKSTPFCKTVSANRNNQYVIVACNKIENYCLPVHYQKYNNQKPGNITCI